MRRTDPPLKRVLLLDQVLLAGIRNRHIAGVYTESWGLTLWAKIVVRCSAVPEEQVARSRAHLDPLTTSVGKPLQSGGSKAIPFVSPLMNAVWLVSKFSVELFRKKMCAFADDETTTVGAVGEQVHKTLQAPEAWFVRVLVLVSPWLVWGKIGAVGKAEVDGIKRDTRIY